MIWLRLALANLSLSPLTTGVNVLLMGLGTASIVLLLLAGFQLTQTMSRDAQGIDLVVGAQGSPVQLILSAVYHADVPPGNVRLSDAQRWADDSRVDVAIPLSLGDSVGGFRIVGTTSEYLDLYDADRMSGRIWTESMEAVLGSAVAQSTAMGVGSTFAGAHGLVDGGHQHEAQPYRVVGVLAPTGTVADRLVLTSLESVWALHDEDIAHDHDEVGEAQEKGQESRPEDHHADDHEHANEEHANEEHAAEHEHDHEAEADHDAREGTHGEDLEITAMLLRYRTPLAATALPREINATGALQAAAPALEISRLLQLVGVGMTALGAFAWVLVATAALSIFAALYGSLRARRGELAMLRCLGASRVELLLYLIAEGLLMSVLGVALGFVAGHGLMELVALWLSSTRGVVMTGWTWVPAESLLLLGLFMFGLASAVIPAIQAYRTDVARTLAEG
tara:strand:+ start:303 stop:1655 length:1353 start_codon:yes stop_codon:yes gene_type:complete